MYFRLLLILLFISGLSITTTLDVNSAIKFEQVDSKTATETEKVDIKMATETEKVDIKMATETEKVDIKTATETEKVDIKTATETEKIDINTADTWTLARELYGIGQKKSAAIVAFRQQHGAFKSVDDLTQVYGISQRLVDENRDKIIASDVIIIPKRQVPSLVNINTADAMTLSRELYGVGYKKAAAIVAFRQIHGPFKSLFDLFQVPGIGKKIIEQNQDKIILQEPELEIDEKP
jgi:competence protein ComEA